MPTNDVLSSRLDALGAKVDELARDIREDITNLTAAVGHLSFVDQRVHDIEIAAMKELMQLNHQALLERADALQAEVDVERERRSLNFRLAVGAIITGVLFPLLVGLAIYSITTGD